jgi:hypothetical protein
MIYYDVLQEDITLIKQYSNNLIEYHMVKAEISF